MKPRPDGWFEYHVSGPYWPEVPEGFNFFSPVENLQNKPELWADNCPYTLPKNNLQDLVEMECVTWKS